MAGSQGLDLTSSGNVEELRASSRETVIGIHSVALQIIVPAGPPGIMVSTGRDQVLGKKQASRRGTKDNNQ